jgi:integrase
MERTKHPGLYRRGDKHVAVVSYRDRAGKRRQKWITARTQGQALTARREFLNGLDKGIRPEAGKAMLASFLADEWLPDYESRVEAGERSRLTLGGYQRAVRKHIVPAIGHLKLGEVNRDHLKHLYRSLSPSVARACHTALSAAFSYALEEGTLGVNPCRMLRTPHYRAPEARHLDRDRARGLLEESKGTRLEGAVVLGLLGLRIGETCGLRWEDVDLAAGRIYVRRSWHGETKTRRMRGFALPPSTTSQLRRYKVRQAEKLLVFGIRQTDETPVVATVYGTQMAPKTLDRLFRPFVQEHGFDVSYHGLRHTAAILLLSAGVDVKTVGGRLGMSPQILLRTYAHFVQAADQAAAERLQEVIGDGRG